MTALQLLVVVFIALPSVLGAAAALVRERGLWTEAPYRPGGRKGLLLASAVGLVVSAALLAALA